MSILYFLLVGIVAGWLAGLIMKGSGYGLLGDLIIGIVGSMIGGHVLGWLNLSIGLSGLLGSIVVALIGAILLILLVRLLKSA
jgi:uncharacterized membrane protein YeaQ/YmgE (transglycosylase-associated protein family)